MAEIEFEYGATSVTLYPMRAQIKRRELLYRYLFINGGSMKQRAGAGYLVDLKWEHLTAAEYADVVGIVDQIRSGAAVKMISTDGFSYFRDADMPSSGMQVDLEDDDFPETSFELFDKMPFQLRLCSTAGMVPERGGDKFELLWGDTEHTFEDVGDDQFGEYN